MPRGRPRKVIADDGIDFASVSDVMVPYQRVSTREQADSGAGLSAQRTALKAGLAMRGQTAYSWDYADEGVSGKNLQREKLNAALEVIRAGKAGGIMVSKLDRLSRSLLDFAHLMATADKEGWNIVALDLGVDLRTPAGKAMAGMLAIFAEFERNVIVQRTRDGLAEKRAEGVILGRKPIDEQLLQTVVGTWREHPSWSAVAHLLNGSGVATPRGGMKWYPGTVQKIVLSANGQRLLETLESAM